MILKLDTHCVAWLFAGSLELFSDAGLELIRSNPLEICPMVELELDYLYEIGRTTEPGDTVIGELRARIGLAVSPTPLESLVKTASQLTWTRDPFDRLIVADALTSDEKLLTRDRVIRANYSSAVW